MNHEKYSFPVARGMTTTMPATMTTTTATTLTTTSISATPLMVTLSVSGDAQIAGEDYTLACSVTGGGTVTPTYRWWKNGEPRPGRTESTIAFTPLRGVNSGVYICEGTRNSIAVNSTSVTLTVRGESSYTYHT